MNPNLSGSNQSKQAGVLSAPTLLPGSLRFSGSSSLSRQCGFTLLEVIVVVAILGIVAAVAVPSFSASIEKQAVRNAAQTLLSHMKQARVRALAENRTVSVSFGVDAAGNTANAYVFDAGTAGAEKKVAVSYGGFSKNLQLTKNNITKKPNTLNFKSRGTVGAATIYFCSSGYSKRIVVNSLGRAYLCGASDTSNSCTKTYACQ